MLSNVTFLLPFLIPDNWINLKESEHQLNAEELTYQIVELNQFASAYALYKNIVDEYDALDVLNDNYHTLYQLYLTLAAENQQTGTVNMDDVKTALEVPAGLGRGHFREGGHRHRHRYSSSSDGIWHRHPADFLEAGSHAQFGCRKPGLGSRVEGRFGDCT